MSDRGRLFAIGAVLLLQPWGCDARKLDAKRVALAEAAAACPAPATCTETHHGDGNRDYKVCAGMPMASLPSKGDIVIVHEAPSLDLIARFEGPHGPLDYDVTFADGNKVPRPKSSFVSRVCK